MKFFQFYLIAILIMIGILAASTWWNFQQFQDNFKKIGVSLPPEITKIPDSNDILGKIMNQGQTQEQKTATTSTKEFIAPDGNFKLDFPASWQETSDIPSNFSQEKTIFGAYKTGSNALLATSYLIVSESSASSTDAIIQNYKENAESGNYQLKIIRSEIVNDGKTTDIIRAEYKIDGKTTGSGIDFSVKNALIEISGKIYSISVIAQGSDESFTQTAENIFDSITLIGPQAEDKNNQ